MDIDLLEKRIAALELQVYPQHQKPSYQSTVTELLHQTNSMTTTALSCREVVISILRQMEAINDYLNPSYCEGQLELQDRVQYITELYSPLKKTLKSLAQFDDLKLAVGSPAIDNIPQLVSKLERLTIANVEAYNECKSITDEITIALKRYHDIIFSIKVIFAQIEEAIASIEGTSQRPLVKND